MSDGCWRHRLHGTGASYTQAPPGDGHSAELIQSAPHGQGSCITPPGSKHPTPAPPSLTRCGLMVEMYLSNHRVQSASSTVFVVPRARSRRAVGAGLASDPGGPVPQLLVATQAGGRRMSRQRSGRAVGAAVACVVCDRVVVDTGGDGSCYRCMTRTGHRCQRTDGAARAQSRQLASRRSVGGW